MKKSRKLPRARGFQPMSVEQQELVAMHAMLMLAVREASDKLSELDPTKTSDDWFAWALQGANNRIENAADLDEIEERITPQFVRGHDARVVE